MDTFLNLTTKELEMMKVFWNFEKPVTIQEFISEYDPTANDTTIHFNLKRLIEKGFIEVAGKTIVTRTPARLYVKKVTLEEYMVNQVLAVYAVNNKFDITKFLTVLYRNKDLNLSLKDIEDFTKKLNE